MDTIALLAPYFEHYVVLNGFVDGATYNYLKKGFRNRQVIDHKFVDKKSSKDSWLYVAVRAGANLSMLHRDDKLYVGSQTSDRMFRGDGLDGINFHHGPMRAGNGERNLEIYLRNGGKVDIHQVSKAGLQKAVSQVEVLRRFAPLIEEKHPGFLFEQLILMLELKDWQWNTAGAVSSARRIIVPLLAA